MAPPIWRDHHFASIFLEPYLDEVEGEPALPPIGESISFVHTLLRELVEAYPSDGAIRSASEFCSDAAKLHSFRLSSLSCQPFLEFLGMFVQRVQKLRAGESLLTPTIWTACSGSLFVLGKSAKGSNDYTLAVCSTGDGVRYHPTHPCLLDGRLQRAVTLWLTGIPLERIGDSSFWFGLFQCVSQLSWSQLYERLLPYGTQRPLTDFFPSFPGRIARDAMPEPHTDDAPLIPSDRMHFRPSDHSAESHWPTRSRRLNTAPKWRTLPSSGPHRNFITVIEALRAALAFQVSRSLLLQL